MKIRCAWCGKDMGEKPGAICDAITHGICDECAARVKREFAGMVLDGTATLETRRAMERHHNWEGSALRGEEMKGVKCGHETKEEVPA